jgi:hypothetical protein
MFRELLMLQKQQTVKDAPMVPDVNRIQIAPHRTYTFQRTVDIGQITPSTTVETDSTYVFALNQLPDYTEFTSLFDNYRILQVTVCFYPLFLDTTATTPYPPIKTVIDYDDNVSVTLAQANEYDSLQVNQTGNYFERTLTPRIAVAAYAAGVFSSFMQPKAQSWVDCASPGVNHYGLKYAMPVSGAANPVWQVEAHYILQFRETR